MNRTDRKHRRSSSVGSIIDWLVWAERGVALTVALSALALGGAHIWAVLLGTLILAVCGVLAFWSGSFRRIPAPALALAALGAYSLIQSIPVPIDLLAKLSPQAADAWARSLLPVDQAVRYGSLSLDPGASSVEAAKWVAYSVVFALSASRARRRGASFWLAVVFASALAVALATVAHGLVGATQVFGLYEPTFGPSRWHIGPILNPNCLAGYLLLGVFCGLGFILSRPDTAPRGLWAVGVAVLIGVTLLSSSRGGVSALLVGIATFAVFLYRARARARRLRWPDWVAMGSPLLVGLVFSLMGARDTTWSLLFGGDLSKIEMWKWVVPLLRDFPLFGVGRGAFETVFPAYEQAANHIVYSNPENVVIQWVSEWGLPIGCCGLMSLLWMLRPSRLGFGQHMAVSGAVIGVGVLVLQNFVDFGLELFGPALAVTVVLGACWGQASNAVARADSPERARAAVVLALLLGSVGLAFARGRHPAAVERAALYTEYASLAPQDAAAARELWSHIRDAIGRHPAEPYFPRLAAAMALRVGSADGMRWANQALERCPSDSRTHLIIARVLQKRGALAQALMEARLAVEYDPGLAMAVGKRVARWSDQFDSIVRAAPRGTPGADVLLAASRAVDPKQPTTLREDLLREAVRRAPESARAERELAYHLLNGLNGERCAGEARSACEAQALTVAKRLDQLAPESADGVEIVSRVYSVSGRGIEAEKLLNERCPNLEDKERVRCWRVLFLIARGDRTQKSELVHAAQRFVEAACSLDDQCEGALIQAGDAMRTIEDWVLAFGYYERAARRNPVVGNLLRVADAASALGRISTAQRALAIAGARVGPNSAESRQIADRRAALLRSTLR